MAKFHNSYFLQQDSQYWKAAEKCWYTWILYGKAIWNSQQMVHISSSTYDKTTHLDFLHCVQRNRFRHIAHLIYKNIRRAVLVFMMIWNGTVYLHPCWQWHIGLRMPELDLICCFNFNSIFTMWNKRYVCLFAF